MGKLLKVFFRSRPFTLLEIIVSLAIFSILLTAGICFYNTVISINLDSSNVLEVRQNAQVALNLMARDIECLYYGGEGTAFWHWKPAVKPSTWEQYRNELLAFVSQTKVISNTSISDIGKVKYQKYFSTNHMDSNDGWLRRSVTGDLTSGQQLDSDWNYVGNYYVGYTCSENNGVPEAVFTANSKACGDYQKLIPCVIDLSFDCFDKDGDIIDPTVFTSKSSVYNLRDIPPYNKVPCLVDITLTLMDRNSWTKWIVLGGKPNPDEDSGKSLEFRLRHQWTFKRTVLVGSNKSYIF